jgi:hypothetical protein
LNFRLTPQYTGKSRSGGKTLQRNKTMENDQVKSIIKAMNDISDMNGARHQQVLAATLAAGFFANPNITKSLKEADIEGVYDSCFKLARLITE